LEEIWREGQDRTTLKFSWNLEFTGDPCDGEGEKSADTRDCYAEFGKIVEASKVPS
jgi:hypothetical protein